MFALVVSVFRFIIAIPLKLFRTFWFWETKNKKAGLFPRGVPKRFLLSWKRQDIRENHLRDQKGQSGQLFAVPKFIQNFAGKASWCALLKSSVLCWRFFLWSQAADGKVLRECHNYTFSDQWSIFLGMLPIESDKLSYWLQHWNSAPKKPFDLFELNAESIRLLWINTLAQFSLVFARLFGVSNLRLSL